MAAIKRESLTPHTSERIEEAALHLFYEKGFKATTIREIALACGITAGALYNHFPSKDEILSQIMMRVHVDLERTLEEATASAGEDPRDQLKAYCKAHALFHTQSIKEARVASREIDSLQDQPLVEVIEARRRSTALLRDILTRGKTAGVFDVPNVKVVANLILTMAVSIANWYRADGESGDEEVAEMDAQLALRMVDSGGDKGDNR